MAIEIEKSQTQRSLTKSVVSDIAISSLVPNLGVCATGDAISFDMAQLRKIDGWINQLREIDKRIPKCYDRIGRIEIKSVLLDLSPSGEEISLSRNDASVTIPLNRHFDGFSAAEATKIDELAPLLWIGALLNPGRQIR